MKYNLTVNELANRAGVSVGTIYNLKNNRAQKADPPAVKALEAPSLGQRLESDTEIQEASQINGLGDFVDFDSYDINNLPDVALIFKRPCASAV